MTTSSSLALRELFFGSATQYYVTGRFAVLAGQSPVAGNLLHHAIEMYLKGGLSKTRSLRQLKQLSHRLPAVWLEFKQEFSACDLDEFDSVVAALHEFEELRYPDSIAAHGARITMGIEPFGPMGPQSASRTEPNYQLFLDDVDALVRAVFSAVPVNPQFFLGSLPSRARESLLHANKQNWAG